MKENISIEKYSRLINSGCVVLVTSSFKERVNILSMAWHMPVSKNPPLLAISVHNEHFSYELIRKSKEFVINVPPAQLARAVQYCGSVSGRDIDKFSGAGLTRLSAEQVGAPLIKECIAHIECKVIKLYPEGDHGIFIARILNAVVDSGLFDGECLLVDKPLAHTLHHLGLNRYITAEKIIRA